jgi:hypothetical protein
MHTDHRAPDRATTSPTVTATCEAGRHQRCAGTILSLTSAHGAPCACGCHQPTGRAA